MSLSTTKKFLALLALLVTTNVQAEATFVINNIDGPGEGFNDGTPATPIGGNPGTTLGEQRLIVVQYALDTWGARVNSGPTIVVRTSNQSLGCEENSGTLAQAGSLIVHEDFPNAPRADTLYPAVLANAIAGFDINANAEGLPAGQPDPINSPGNTPSGVNDEIGITINADIGNEDCLGGAPYYLGLDNQPTPGTIDLLNIIMHEAAHGLGFQDFFNQNSGTPSFGTFDIFSQFLFDNVSGLSLVDQPNSAARIEALNNPGQLVWTGENVTANAAANLQQQLVLTFNAPSGSSESQFGTAAFGPPAVSGSIAGEIVAAIDDAGVSPTDGCEPLVNAAAINGNIALIDRGECFFVEKTQIAQDAGATAVIIANNEPGIINMSGDSTTINIPTISISNADGDALRADLENGSVSVTFLVDPSRIQGADPQGRVLLFSPDPPEPGSSIAHFDFSAFPDLLMEPAASSQILAATNVDLTDDLLADLGWSVVSNPQLPLEFPQGENSNTDTGGSDTGGTDTGGTDTGGTDTGGTDTGGDSTPTAPTTQGGGGGGGSLTNTMLVLLLSSLFFRTRRARLAMRG